MARAWQYPRWRRIVMQATLWLILGCATGLAALVTHHRIGANHVDLAKAFSFGQLKIRLPAEWAVAQGDDDSLHFIGPEDPDFGDRLELAVLGEQLNQRISPAELLSRSRLLPGTFTGGDDDSPPLRAVTLAGSPGVMVKVLRLHRTQEMNQQPHEELIVAAVLPSDLAIVLQMDCPRPDDDGAAEELIREVAARITVSDSSKSPSP